ncbi:hypothetical protein [Burkholderia pseudomallei]|uniref:hypothetical protein n=2 Tax=Burkholderia pseudomallei TaxID=28450 RepID=UPI000AFFAB82|nr:hypothetical protein [Burkholderia pseudomallei]MBF3536946.1 hypothetical protein [Burkholderia pseudomallei]MBF3602600.1 hypothetical protein [Burkholderia pseudomallei]
MNGKEDRTGPLTPDLSGMADSLAQGDEPEALRRIKELRAAGGTPLTRDETVEFITRPIWMGYPEPQNQQSEPKRRGRPAKRVRTQYDHAIDRRKDLYRRLVKLPNVRTGKGYIDRTDIERRLEECRAKKVPRHKWVSTTCASLERDGKPCEERTVRRVKKEWESR